MRLDTLRQATLLQIVDRHTESGRISGIRRNLLGQARNKVLISSELA